MHKSRRRALTASAVVAGLAVTSLAWTSATAANPGATGAGAPTRSVIVLLRNQHTDLQAAKGMSSPRALAAHHDQAPLLASARAMGARNLRQFAIVNGFAATVTAAQANQLAADPSVLGVFPDRPIPRPADLPDAGGAAATGRGTAAPSTATSQTCPTDPAHPLLEPEALQTTHTAFTDPNTPQARSLATGRGVKVAWIADGIDVDNPDFIRSDGSHVIVDYQDFSGEGLAAPTNSLESFGDASSIAAQGRQVYDLSTFVNPAHALPPGCTITVRGMAPDAQLVGLKVFGNAPTAPTSRFIEAIDYAVNVAKVDVLNESFGANLYPDFSQDPVALADDAAVAAGVTVVSSTGDAGTAGTVQTPSSDPNVIGVAGTTTFRAYLQTGQSGAQLSNGTWADDNISALSGGGTTQAGRVPDLSAPGDLGWALCSPDLTTFQGCTDFKGAPTNIQLFGGTSESSPLVSGAAALVIQAYEDTHHGVRPAPALVKRLLTSTATDLGHPAYEQGAGEVNALAAVQAARSWHDANGSPARATDAIVLSPTQLSLAGNPGQTVHQTLTLTNAGGQGQTVHLSTRALGRETSRDDGTMTLDTATAPTFIDVIGTVRAYTTHTFTVPPGADRLDASVSAVSPSALVRMTLLDPSGTFTAYDIPQGFGNFGHADVRFPKPGTWTAIVFMSRASGFSGPVPFSFVTHKFTTAGSVSPATLFIPAGATRTVTVSARMSSQVGDLSAAVQITRAHGDAVSVPLTERTRIPTDHQVNAFTGVVTGGNGRQPGFTGANAPYEAIVPPGKRDMSIGVDLPTDPNDIIIGVLTGPDGQVASVQSNLNFDNDGNPVVAGGFVVNRRDPRPGKWSFWFIVVDPVSGLEVAQTFHATLSFNTVQVSATLPHGHLAAGVPVTVPVTIKNTGVAPQTYFTDARLNATGDYTLADLGAAEPMTLPLAPGVTPLWLVPSEMSHLAVTANADTGVNLDLEYTSGTPEIYSANVNNSATSSLDAAAVSAGIWSASIGETGPFDGPAPAGQVTTDAVVHGQLFDTTVTSTTGDVWQAGILSGPTAALTAAMRAGQQARLALTHGVAPARAGHPAVTPAAPGDPTGPLTIAPGQSATVWVTFTPTGHGPVRGHLYVDTFGFFQNAGDEVIDLPYAYTVG